MKCHFCGCDMPEPVIDEDNGGIEAFIKENNLQPTQAWCSVACYDKGTKQ